MTAAVLGFGGSSVRATVIPRLVTSGGSAGHLPGTPGGASFGAALTSPTTQTPGFDTDFDPNIINFPSGSSTGNTSAKVGIGHSESAGVARINFASGTGISQLDPGKAQSFSTLEYQFGSTWAIDSAGFGPPVTTAFSLPVARKIGAGGSASVFIDVHWDMFFGSVPIPDARTPYTTTQTYGPGSQITSFNAPPAPWAVSKLSTGDTVTMRGTIRFTVNNDDEPSIIGIPSLEDFPEFAGTPEFNMEAGMSVAPEPTGLGLLGGVAILSLAARRRRPARAVAAV